MIETKLTELKIRPMSYILFIKMGINDSWYTYILSLDQFYI